MRSRLCACSTEPCHSRERSPDMGSERMITIKELVAVCSAALGCNQLSAGESEVIERSPARDSKCSLEWLHCNKGEAQKRHKHHNVMTPSCDAFQPRAGADGNNLS